MDFEKMNSEFKEKLSIISPEKTADWFMKESIAAGAILSIIALYSGLFIAKEEFLAALAFPSFFLPLVLNYFFVLLRFENRKIKIESEVPDMLFTASSLPAGTGINEMIKFMTKNKGTLQEEFLIVSKQVNAGMPIEEAIELMKKRNKSAGLARALDMIQNSLKTGAEMNSVFRETAEDLLNTNSIIRERNANLTIEKYTILIAGGVIVPLLLGLITGMISGFDFSTASELGIGMAIEKKREMAEAALLGNIIYILEYSVIASAFVAFQEGNEKKAVLYAVLLVPASVAVYFIGVGW